MALSDLGITADLERLYRALLANSARETRTADPAATGSATAGQPTYRAEDLASELGQPLEQVQAGCDQLVELGVLKRDPAAATGLVVPKPAAALGQLIERCEDDLLRRYRRASETRSVISELDLIFSATAEREPDDNGVERVEDVHAIRERLEELSFFTRTSVYAIQPGGPQSRESLEASRPLDQRGIRRGVEMRLIHEASVLDDELNRAYLRELVMGGA
ncbi:MAG: hypothetical protein ABI418_01720, partial [Jatrophihabitantaceae bacterium]